MIAFIVECPSIWTFAVWLDRSGLSNRNVGFAIITEAPKLPLSRYLTIPAPSCDLRVLLDLPEDIMDDVDDFARPHVDEQCIVIIADPPRPWRCRWKSIHPWIGDPVTAAEIIGP